MGQELSTNLGSCFYVISNFVPKPVAEAYSKFAGDNYHKINPARAKLR